MNKQIEVIKEDGSAMTSTFPKRAKQLVKSGRARWINDDAICLLENEEDQEEPDMESNSNDPRRAEPERSFGEAGYVVAEEPLDEKIYKMAKKRVEERSALLTHVAAYLAVTVFITAVWPGDDWQMYVIGGWGIGVACHVASYFTKSTPQAVHKEYAKIKKKYYR